MRGWIKWVVGLFAVLVVLLGLAVFALSQWAGSADFRDRAQQMASSALGVPVTLGRIEIVVLPSLAVALHQVRIGTKPPLTLEQIDATPVWSSLLAGKPTLDALVVRKAVLPQQGIMAVATAAQKQQPASKPATPSAGPPPLPRRIVLDDVTWVDAAGQKLTVNAEVRFEGDLLPQNAKIDVVGGRFAGAKARLERQAELWQLRADIGGGTVTGPLRMQPQKNGGWRFSGDLATKGVEVSALTAPSKALTGRIEAKTSLGADFKDPGQLADVMRSQTHFTVRNAVLHGIDLAQAVRTLGVSRSGTTTLDTLTGDVATQGRAVHLTNLVANSGLLSATGHVSLAPDRSLSGKVSAVVGGGPLTAGVPLAVAGTVDSPSVYPTGIKLPGSDAVGNVGSKIGEGLKGLFGK
ncbi:hypothetical protein [Ramlibacter algicola]|uniref:AsmA family protein n=1 Tax=Ramlibacter algicola TaxID=2795217 RepID=A0A934PVT1_9BURK|nr:hypothetical protein [Ramlibacter algicola]MBK0391384.1 hypothetical protein [Ramlibacter algicola]